MKFGLFVLLYSLTKLSRMMMAATVWMAAVFAVCQIGRSRTWRLNLGMLSLVPLACLMGYSKIFFAGRLFLVTNWIHGMVTEKMAVCYFGIAGMLAVRYVHMHSCMRRRLSGMRRLEEETVFCMLRDKRPGIRVYLTDECGSPFAGGILRPYIVIPVSFKNRLSQEEFSAVLCHEVLHIRQGHVLLLHIYAWLKIIWWIHPLIYVLEWKLRENVEYSSDEGSVMLGPLHAYEYAGIILKMLRTERQPSPVREGIMTFYDHCYDVLKRRVERLGKLREDGGAKKEYQKRRRISAALTAAAIAITAAAVIGTSMPRYTKIREISVYDEKLHPLTYDLKKEGFQAEAADSTFYISRQELQRLAAKYELQGEYVIFSYDTIMKVPGIGGFGQAAMVRVADASDVYLLARQEWMDQLQAFVMKYLI